MDFFDFTVAYMTIYIYLQTTQGSNAWYKSELVFIFDFFASPD